MSPGDCEIVKCEINAAKSRSRLEECRMKKNQSRIVSISPTSDDDTVEKAQKLNHDISVDLSAEAINYHQMVCPRHRETSSNQMALAQII